MITISVTLALAAAFLLGVLVVSSPFSYLLGSMNYRFHIFARHKKDCGMASDPEFHCDASGTGAAMFALFVVCGILLTYILVTN